MEGYVVYVLYSEKVKKHYTGCTSNLEERLKSHNIYGKDWTSRFRPWELIYTKFFDTKDESEKCELWVESLLKQMGII
jgi:putative endonuclease